MLEALHDVSTSFRPTYGSGFGYTDSIPEISLTYVDNTPRRVVWQLKEKLFPDTVQDKQPNLTNNSDPWLNYMAVEISKFRNLADNWDGVGSKAPHGEALDIAEVLVAGFTELPMSKRPKLRVDSEGYPTFVTYHDEVYVKITVESSQLVSWYSVIDGVEALDEKNIQSLNISSALNLIREIYILES